jgi:uncharacterized surface protein with fasciclin (FAS1) repeats
MDRKTIIKQGQRVALAACALLMGGAALQSCKDDDILLTGQPEWLGNSIYERLQEYGDYTILLRLIDDVEDNKEILSHTGSRTMFATSDSAYNAWFKTTTWKTGSGEPVRSYEQLSPVQKKVLLNNSMLNNAYLINLMSNVSGNPVIEGRGMRRNTQADIYDSVAVMTVEEMPWTPYWDKLRAKGKPIRIFKDNSRAPMIHFLPDYMKRSGFTASDLALLTNQPSATLEEAWVDGVKVMEANIACKNGYIHRVNGVIEASPNMAEIIHNNPNMTYWSQLLNRFCAPYLPTTRDGNETQLAKFQRIYETEDTVYALRYFSKQETSQNNKNPMNRTTDGVVSNGETIKDAELLKFDPGWNQYVYTNAMNEDLHYDAGVMIVPTDEAFLTWWNGEGRDLKEEYGHWDSIPASTIASLINNNMKEQLSLAVPSRFGNMLNDAKVEMGVKPDNIVASYMGCNGVIYLVNKVFAPAEFSSVMYPATAHPSTMGLIYTAIINHDFKPYLISMDQTYSMLLPTNKALQYFMDPVYYNSATPRMISFSYDDVKKTIAGSRYNVEIDEDGNIIVGSRTQTNVSDAVLQNRLKYLLDELVVLGDITDGHEYYKTKGGSIVRVAQDSEGKLAVQGGWQMVRGCVAPVHDIVQKQNGKSFILDSISALSAEKTVYQTLQEHPEDSIFLSLLDDDGCDLLAARDGLSSSSEKRFVAGENNKNVRLFSNYNYTVYVPTNESLQKLIDAGYLPTWDDYNNQIAEEWGGDEVLADSAKTVLKEIIVNFLRYHIQDNTLMIGMRPETPESGMDHIDYESMLRDVSTGRFMKMAVRHTDDALAVKGLANDAAIYEKIGLNGYANVVKTQGLYNNICREYWFKGSQSNLNEATIYYVSGAVVHNIDKPLLYTEMRPWREILKEIK